MTYLDPESPENCMIQLLPVISENLSAASASWLREFFDAELQKHMSFLEERGIQVPYNVEPPTFTQIATSTYIMYKQLMVPMDQDPSNTILDYQLMILFEYEYLQRLFSILDSVRCPAGRIEAVEFFAVVANDVGSAPTSTAPGGRREEWAAMTAEIIGSWSVTSSGFSAFMYRFNSDGTYEHSGTMESSLANLKVSLFETGTFSIQGDVLILARSGGTLIRDSQREQLGSATETYNWRITVDPYTGGGVLWLTYPDGRQQQFYEGD